MPWRCYKSIIYVKNRNSRRISCKARKKWNPNVKDTNIELISNVTGKQIELVKNETSLPMSKKRKEKYR